MPKNVTNLSTAMAVVAALVFGLVLGPAPVLAVAAPAAVASSASGVTPLLTGGVVHWAGNADRDEQATDTAAASLDNSTDYGEADSPVAWNTHTLVDFHYPDAPQTDFQAGWPITAWDETDQTVIGANGAQHYGEHFVDCDSNDGDVCTSTETKDFACTWTEIGGTEIWPQTARDLYLALWGQFQGLSCSGMTAWDQQSLQNPWSANSTALTYELKVPDQPLHTDTVGPLHAVHGASFDGGCGMIAECDSNTQSGSSEVTVTCALCVTAVELEQRDVSTGRWTPLARDQHTYDGNTVRLLVTVHNSTNIAIQAPVRFRDLTVDRDLALARNGEHPATQTSFAANADTHLTFDWDTAGFAWDTGATSAAHQVAVLTPYGGGEVQQQVAPRPIVLVHGLNSSAATWRAYLGSGGFVAGRRDDWIARRADEHRDRLRQHGAHQQRPAGRVRRAGAGRDWRRACRPGRAQHGRADRPRLPEHP